MPTWEQIHKALETVRAEAHEQFEKAIREMQIPDCPIETFRDAAKEMYNSLGKTSACADFYAALSKLEHEESVPLDIRKAFDIMDVN